MWKFGFGFGQGIIAGIGFLWAFYGVKHGRPRYVLEGLLLALLTVVVLIVWKVVP